MKKYSCQKILSTEEKIVVFGALTYLYSTYRSITWYNQWGIQFDISAAVEHVHALQPNSAKS